MLLERRFLFVVIAILFLSVKIKANEGVASNDSLLSKVSYLVEDRTHFHEFHKISVPEVVVPAAVVGVSSFFVRKEVKDEEVSMCASGAYNAFKRCSSRPICPTTS